MIQFLQGLFAWKKAEPPSQPEPDQRPEKWVPVCSFAPDDPLFPVDGYLHIQLRGGGGGVFDLREAADQARLAAAIQKTAERQQKNPEPL